MNRSYLFNANSALHQSAHMDEVLSQTVDDDRPTVTLNSHLDSVYKLLNKAFKLRDELTKEIDEAREGYIEMATAMQESTEEYEEGMEEDLFGRLK